MFCTTFFYAVKVPVYAVILLNDTVLVLLIGCFYIPIECVCWKVVVCSLSLHQRKGKEIK